MIEWVPIKDFELNPIFGSFLILVEGQYETKKVYMATYQVVGGHGIDQLIYVEDALYFSPIFPYKQYPSRYFQGFKVTHAAPLNFPDKTLEDKFKSVWPKPDEAYNVDFLVHDLSKIAKQHYEGKE